MLTRLEISGFKSFVDFEVDFTALTVIAGANATGKSNLLEAIRLVQGLAQRGSFGKSLPHQGNLKDIFTKYNAVAGRDSITVAVELKLPATYLRIAPDFLLDYTRFRYEVEITHHADDLEGIWYEISKEKLCATEPDKQRVFIEYPEKLQPGQSIFNQMVRDNFTYTQLSEASLGSDPHVFACQRAIRGIIVADLIAPENFSDYDTPRKSTSLDKNGILKSLARFAKSAPEQLHFLGRRLRRIVPSLVSIDVYTDAFDRSTVTATDTDGRQFLASNLSEGTLRIIALASYLIKRKDDQVLLLEEPENGIDPRAIDEVLHLLLDLSVARQTSDEGYWQVICTTHSPILLQAALNLNSGGNVSVLLSNKVAYVCTEGGKRYNIKVTRMNPVGERESVERSGSPLERYTLREAMEYLAAGYDEKTPANA